MGATINYRRAIGGTIRYQQTAGIFPAGTASYFSFNQGFLGYTSLVLSAVVRITNLGQVRYSEIMRRQAGGIDILLAFQQYGGALSFGITTDDGTGGRIASYTQLDVAINAADFQGKDVYVEAQWDGTAMRIYTCQPGGQRQLLGSQPKTGQMLDVGSGTQVFVGTFAQVEVFEGRMNEVRLFTAVPSAAYLQAHSFRALPAPTTIPSLLTYFRFREPPGSQMLVSTAASANTALFSGLVDTVPGGTRIRL